MTVYDLNRDQLAQLKIDYYSRGGAEDISYDEMANIDDLVSDEEIYEEYAGTVFTPDDFWHSVEDDEDYFLLDLNDCTGTNEMIADTLEIISSRIRDHERMGVVNGAKFVLAKF